MPRKPRKIVTTQPSYTLLVANLKGGSDPSKGVAGNPVKARTGITYQHFPEVSRLGQSRGPNAEDPSTPGIDTKMGHVAYTTPPVPVPASSVITVADNDFSDPATLLVGENELISGEHFLVGGTEALTAINVAAAIDALPEFTATAVGTDVTVEGQAGPGGNAILIDAVYAGAIENFTFTPDTGTLAGGEPTIGPPIILP